MNTYIIGEIGINHNGDLKIAKQMIREAAAAGLTNVKFQKRTPEICVPKSEWDKERDTPWGKMKYIDYKKKIEFGKAEYDEIDKLCKELGITWSASVWDIESVKFINEYDVPYIKIPSASITDIELLEYVRDHTEKPLIFSTGMSTLFEVKAAMEIFKDKCVGIMACNSAYPSNVDEINLLNIKTLQELYGDWYSIGYSGHEKGYIPTLGAAALGAEMIERHITLDKTMWGTDQKASLDFTEVKQMVQDIDSITRALGSKDIYCTESEEPCRKKLRKV